MDELLKTLKEYLEHRLNGRRYCPACMGMLPDRHYEDCHLGKLVLAYVEASRGR